MPLLKVEGLKKYYYSGLFKKKVIKAVDGVSFELEKGRTLGLVGASGSGKSTLGRTILRLLEPTAGRVFFEGKDLLGMKGKGLKKLGTEMQIIFQQPEASLNPRMKIYDSIAEPLRIHRLCKREEEKARILELLDAVSLNKELLSRYPSELSGGQLQRAVIARVLGLNPKLIVADEPTSMLDPLVQAQVLSLLKSLQEERGISFLFISHDMDVVKWMSDEIAVMDNGQIADFR